MQDNISSIEPPIINMSSSDLQAVRIVRIIGKVLIVWAGLVLFSPILVRVINIFSFFLVSAPFINQITIFLFGVIGFRILLLLGKDTQTLYLMDHIYRLRRYFTKVVLFLIIIIVMFFGYVRSADLGLAGGFFALLFTIGIILGTAIAGLIFYRKLLKDTNSPVFALTGFIAPYGGFVLVMFILRIIGIA